MAASRTASPFYVPDGSLDIVTDFIAGEDKIMVSRSGFGFAQLRLSSGTDHQAATNAGTILFDTDRRLAP